MTADTDLIAARARAEEAKRRLMQSTHTLQERVAPSRLANDAIETVKERGSAALDGATRVAFRRPGMVAAAAVGFVAFLARRRLFRLVRRRPKQVTIPAEPKRVLPHLSGDKK